MFASLLLRSFELEITPLPSPAERAAIMHALAQLEPAEPRDGWWQAGLIDPESLHADDRRAPLLA